MYVYIYIILESFISGVHLCVIFQLFSCPLLGGWSPLTHAGRQSSNSCAILGTSGPGRIFAWSRCGCGWGRMGQMWRMPYTLKVMKHGMLRIPKDFLNHTEVEKIIELNGGFPCWNLRRVDERAQFSWIAMHWSHAEWRAACFDRFHFWSFAERKLTIEGWFEFWQCQSKLESPPVTGWRGLYVQLQGFSSRFNRISLGLDLLSIVYCMFLCLVCKIVFTWDTARTLQDLGH